jgi:succinate dehydrogenase/fumarate reductase flavoprotein subunit
MEAIKMIRAEDARTMEWPYPIDYDKENEISADVLVLGGGPAGCFAAITAARKGLKVVLVDKAAVKRSGSAGSGIDHYGGATTNPASQVTPEASTQSMNGSVAGWMSGLNHYIGCRESWDALLDLEKMGMKIRDTEDEFKGAEFRDEKTKLLFAGNYDDRSLVRIWGTGMKPALNKECRRVGVRMVERVMVTSLLTEGGKQGARVVGATGINTHTGEFYIFKGKATVLCMSRHERLWVFSTEFIGFTGSSFRPAINAGDGHAMAWRVGGEFTLMEKSVQAGGGFNYPSYGVGNPRNTWFACTMVDSNGKEVPWVSTDGGILETVEERYHNTSRKQSPQIDRVERGPHSGRITPQPRDPSPDYDMGEFTPPFYADLPSMPEHERRVIFGLMVGQEGKTNIPVYHTLTQAGFEPDQDMLQYYNGSWWGVGPPQWRRPDEFYSGGLIPNWDLMTNLEGLFAAGDQLLTGVGVGHASATGRYAGRKAVEYVQKAGEPVFDRSQVDAEKTRVYAPVKRRDGIDWKELEAGIARVMQDYCGPVKNEQLLNLGLKWLDEIKEGEAAELFARNPHELMRAIEVLDIHTVGEMVIHASLARKASNGLLGFKRSDYPEENPPEWQKWITTRLVDGKVRVGELPLDFWGSMKENYEAHCGL